MNSLMLPMCTQTLISPARVRAFDTRGPLLIELNTTRSIFQVPGWVHKEVVDMADFDDWTERGNADGNSVQPDSDFGKHLLLQANRYSNQSTLVLIKARNKARLV